MSVLEKDHDTRVTTYTELHHATAHPQRGHTANQSLLESVTRSVSISVYMGAISDAVYRIIKSLITYHDLYLMYHYPAHVA